MSSHIVEDSKCAQILGMARHISVDCKYHLKTLCKFPRMSDEKDEDLSTTGFSQNFMIT